MCRGYISDTFQYIRYYYLFLFYLFILDFILKALFVPVYFLIAVLWYSFTLAMKVFQEWSCLENPKGTNQI